MDNLTIGIVGLVVSAVLLALFAHPVFLLTLVVSGVLTGWNAGKRYIPVEDTA